MGYAYDPRPTAIDPSAAEALGAATDSIDVVEKRVRRLFRPPVIAWEGDAATFQFTYVSPTALDVFGYPLERWTREPSFWADQIVVPEDRNEAVAYCALATAKRRDHVFEYRARTADGRVLLVRDVVRVLLGPKGIAERLRGLMFEVGHERAADVNARTLRAAEKPSRAELELT